MATTRFLCAGVIAAVIAGAGLAGALPEVYSKQGRYPVTTTVLTVQRSEGIGLPFQCTVYYPTNEGAGGGRCTDVASCYLQSIGTAQNAPVADAGNFPLVAFGLNTFISGQEVYGSTMRHIASHGFVVAATNSRYIQPAAEAIDVSDAPTVCLPVDVPPRPRVHPPRALAHTPGLTPLRSTRFPP